MLVVGLVLLVLGAEWLVRGASRLAQAFGVSPLVIGLTIVAFGTSAPELAVSAFASFHGNADIAIGNVVGSNIFNVLVILGISAIVMPLVVHTQLIRLDVPLMILASGAIYLLAMDGNLSRLEGIGLFIGICLYTWFLVQQSRRESKEAQAEFSSNSPQQTLPRKFGLLIDWGLIVVGLAALMIGSKFLVDSSTAIARAVGISELIIGLTIVAAGTSLPELATSVVAAYRGQRDIAVGNVVGSNLFNILSVLGLSAVISPQGIAVSGTVLNFDLPVMIAVAVTCLPVFYTGYVITRANGIVFLAYYVAYVTYLILQQYQLPVLSTFRYAMISFVIPPTVATILVLAVWQWRKNRATPTAVAAHAEPPET